MQTGAMRAYHAMKHKFHRGYNIKSSEFENLTLKHAKLVELIRAVVPGDSKKKSSLAQSNPQSLTTRYQLATFKLMLILPLDIT